MLTGVEAKGIEVLTGTLATISCVVTGLTQALDSVSWEKPNDGGTINSNADGFIFDDGSQGFDGSSQTTTLTIPTNQNNADGTYKCVVTSNEHSKVDEETEVQSKVFSKLSTKLPIIDIHMESFKICFKLKCSNQLNVSLDCSL